MNDLVLCWSYPSLEGPAPIRAFIPLSYALLPCLKLTKSLRTVGQPLGCRGNSVVETLKKTPPSPPELGFISLLLSLVFTEELQSATPNKPHRSVGPALN